jgi:amino acid transporter, AAT family
MTMVAVGGSISTGLLLGSAAALQIAGPSVIFSYIIAAFIAYTVTMALGELASTHPAAGSFGIYGELYLTPYLGFLCRAGYWASIAFSIGAELVASATYMTYWFPAVPGEFWVVLFSVALVLVNLLSVGSFGRFEFWLSMIKFATIVVFILAGSSPAFQRPCSPAIRGSWRISAQRSGRTACSPSSSPSTPSAVSRCSPSPPANPVRLERHPPRRSPHLLPARRPLPRRHHRSGRSDALESRGASESPFVSVLSLAKVPAAAFFMNFVVLTAALSGANAKLYVASRLLFSMGRTGWAPASLGRLNAAGSPHLALLVSSYGIVTALIIENWAPKQAFLYIMGAAFSGLILSWVVSLAAHVSFRWRLTPQQVAALPMRSPLGVWGSMLGFVLVSAAVFQTLLPRASTKLAASSSLPRSPSLTFS